MLAMDIAADPPFEALSGLIKSKGGKAVTSGERSGAGNAWGALMAAAQDGDGAAYARLLAEIAPMLRRVVRARWGETDSEDIVQETLISLHRVRHTYDPARPFMPWLMAIAQFRIADAARKSARRGVHERPEWSFECGLPDVAAEEANEPQGDPQLLRRALAELPDGQRRAVQLLKLEERSLKEAAAETGMTVGALKVAVHRGLKALRAAMTGTER
jgi:RNA polymerase sigma-70 factor (ECF subfamily)